jgi:hypothetical protein
MWEPLTANATLALSLKQYTDAIVEKLGSKNMHAGHKTEGIITPAAQECAGYVCVHVVFLRGAASVPSLLGEKEGEEIEERCNPTAATDDKLFARGSNAFMEGLTGEQQ